MKGREGLRGGKEVMFCMFFTGKTIRRFEHVRLRLLFLIFYCGSPFLHLFLWIFSMEFG